MATVFNSNPIVATTAILGLANHFYFKRHEPVRTTVIHTALVLLLEPAIQLFVLQRIASIDISVANVTLAYLVFFSSLAMSIVLYRISPFHPLAKIPGPVIFKITKFWRMYICWTGQQHFVVMDLHRRYGPIVRTGPNEISVIDLASVKAVLGSEGLPKGPAYLRLKDAGQPHSLIGTAGQERTDRRRIWSRGFTSESLKEYQPIIVSRGNEMSEGLAARAGSELDLEKWLAFYTLDFVSEMVLGYKTEMLKKGQDDTGLMELIRTGARVAEIIGHVTWVTHLANLIPTSNLDLRQVTGAWGQRRVETGSKTKDLWYHLTDEGGHEKVKPNPAYLRPEAALALIAGSDTTSTAMTNFFWFILADPKVYKRVRDEVDREYPPGTDPLRDTSRHGNMTFMKACINEGLRVYPPVLTNCTRVVPKGSGGKFIGGHFIAEGTQVQVPPVCVHYNPDHFSPSPESFIPERWIPKEAEAIFKGQAVKMKMEAFIPFSYGPAICIGKHLAMLEMMMVLIMMIQRFDFEFAPDFDWKEWPEKKVDVLATRDAPLKVVVKPRA
ncbi:hypothetical protein AAF712_012947 [Marasmius tenuissimus]|uniref:Cytochrome P450 n=1 Tax=Marasmius tenuissimus TaxID=585030 RepID=A0ABR2ZF51_9AGAR